MVISQKKKKKNYEQVSRMGEKMEKQEHSITFANPFAKSVRFFRFHHLIVDEG